MTAGDASGAVLPAVELTVEDARQNTWKTVTGASGQFEFPQLEPGRYVLHASLPGFRALRHDFELRNARDWDRAVTLQVGDVMETIAVRVQRPLGMSEHDDGDATDVLAALETGAHERGAYPAALLCREYGHRREAHTSALRVPRA